jgi:hypothetical protein
MSSLGVAESDPSFNSIRLAVLDAAKAIAGGGQFCGPCCRVAIAAIASRPSRSPATAYEAGKPVLFMCLADGAVAFNCDGVKRLPSWREKLAIG